MHSTTAWHLITQPAGYGHCSLCRGFIRQLTKACVRGATALIYLDVWPELRTVNKTSKQNLRALFQETPHLRVRLVEMQDSDTWKNFIFPLLRLPTPSLLSSSLYSYTSLFSSSCFHSSSYSNSCFLLFPSSYHFSLFLFLFHFVCSFLFRLTITSLLSPTVGCPHWANNFPSSL